jgi:AcrR family transcriptional regulator
MIGYQEKDTPVDNKARSRILSAARTSFFAHGFRSVTMDQLAEELAMSKKTLYAHFPSKHALLEALLNEKFTGIEADLERVTRESAADFLAGLERLLECVQRHTEEVQPPFVRDLQREGPELFKVVEARRGEIIRRHVGKLLADGRRQGLIRKDVPERLVIEILLGAVQSIMNPPRMAELGLTPTTGFRAIISVILQGALSPKRKPASAKRNGVNHEA